MNYEWRMGKTGFGCQVLGVRGRTNKEQACRTRSGESGGGVKADWRFEISEWEQRQPPHPNAGFGYRDHRAGSEVITALFKHVAQKGRESFGLQPFDADTNDGGSRCPRESQVRMEIRIQSNDDLAALAGVIEDGSVIGGRKAPVSNVLRLQPQFAQTKHRGTRQALVEK